MVKLIRLTTQDPDGFFNNEFKSEIIIPANGRIALHSLTAEINVESITIDAQNDNIKFKWSDNQDFRSFHILNGFYNSSNFFNLFSDISLKMNRLMEYASSELGFQWKVGTDIKSKKVSFECKQGETINPDPTNNKCFFKNSIGSTGGTNINNNVCNRTFGNVGTADSFIYMNTPQCKGSSTFRGRIFKYTLGGIDYITNNTIIGYMDTPPDTNTTLIDLSKIKYGIKVNTNGTDYSYFINGVETTQTTPTTIKSAIGDFMSIDAYKNKIYLNIYKSSVPTNIANYDYDNTIDLFPVVIFLGNTTSKFQSVRFTSDPWYNINNTIINYAEPSLDVPSIKGIQSIKTINFVDAELAVFFGFKKSLPESPDVIGCVITSDYSFQPADFSDSFIIELLNLSINSYDGLTKERRNFLHTIVQADIIRNRLTYTAPYLLFLDLMNTNDISLRKITCRLLKEDLSQVNLTGISQITLIIE